jgi:hypothetical protein
MFGVKSLQRIRVQYFGPGQVLGQEDLEALPRPLAVLAAPPQRESPVARDLLPARFEPRQVSEGSDSAELSGFSRFRPRPCCLPLRLTASALRSKRFRSSILSPHVPLSNASRPALRRVPHDSVSGWFATPFLCDSFIHYSMPVFTRAPDHRYFVVCHESAGAGSRCMFGRPQKTMACPTRGSIRRRMSGRHLCRNGIALSLWPAASPRLH